MFLGSVLGYMVPTAFLTELEPLNLDLPFCLVSTQFQKMSSNQRLLALPKFSRVGQHEIFNFVDLLLVHTLE